EGKGEDPETGALLAQRRAAGRPGQGESCQTGDEEEQTGDTGRGGEMPGGSGERRGRSGRCDRNLGRRRPLERADLADDDLDLPITGDAQFAAVSLEGVPADAGDGDVLLTSLGIRRGDAQQRLGLVRQGIAAEVEP